MKQKQSLTLEVAMPGPNRVLAACQQTCMFFILTGHNLSAWNTSGTMLCKPGSKCNFAFTLAYVKSLFSRIRLRIICTHCKRPLQIVKVLPSYSKIVVLLRQQDLDT